LAGSKLIDDTKTAEEGWKLAIALLAIALTGEDRFSFKPPRLSELISDRGLSAWERSALFALGESSIIVDMF
jgi:hypothetical protein